ncbi:MAG: DNA-binding response regulator, partial [Opitutae bacterium]
MQSVNSITGKEVLVLEDDILLGKRIEAFLSDLGMEVTAVGTCAEAQVALKEMFFDFALFDLNLPDGD